MKDCNQCGKCCTKYGGGGGLSASASEIDWWESHRPEIARYVSNGKIWIDPDTGEYTDACPWLEISPGEAKFTCRIYHDRPEDCRYYPVRIEEMVRDECEMLERRDLMDRRAAQRKLDDLMGESRPPVK